MALLKSENIILPTKYGPKSKPLQEVVAKKGPTLKRLLQLGPMSKKDANDHVIRLLDRGQNLVGNGQTSDAIVNYKVANLLLKEFEDDTETELLIKCLKCLGDVYQSMGNEQEAKKYRRVLANVKKRLKPKNLAKKDLVDDCTSVVESIFQPQYAQNDVFDFDGYDCDEDLLGENERLT